MSAERMARGADTEAWMTSVRRKLYKLDYKVQSPALPTIYRVPETIRRSDRQAYEPEIVSIGPYHRRKKKLQGMEKHKWQYLHEFLSRNKSLSLEYFLDEVKKMEEEAWSFYSEHIPMGSCEFAEMMVLDGCFLIELFLKLDEKKFYNTDPIYGIDWVLQYVARDVLLTENQLPFVVLRRIYSFSSYSSSSPSPSSPSLETLAMNFFRNSDYFIRCNSRLVEMERTHHLLHLVHSYLLPPPPSLCPDPSHNTVSLINSLLKKIFVAKSSCPSIPICNKRESSSFASPAAMNVKFPSHGQSFSLTNPWQKVSDVIKDKKSLSSCPLIPIFNKPKNVTPNPLKTVPSAKRLQEAGVKFKKKQGESALDIKFSKGKMDIPHLFVEDSINTLFRNLIAFEQSCPANGTNFTVYAVFMDYLVNTSKDVEVLHKEGILEHGLGSNEEVAELFNRMCKGVIIPLDSGWFSQVTEDVIRYYNTDWHQWEAMLFRDYFGSPWSWMSFLAASGLFVLTLLQTIYTMKP
ncbi:UPF0481 protein At3g47200-like [Aristolochia californica]|uniref:UPF0481 protein At3g47200-like n=1 Tax=Aristolochia californica TaxID=171875 RepID=UPI0035DAF23D